MEKTVKRYIGNAFSLQMLGTFPTTITVEEVTREEALATGNESVVGHPDTAIVLGVAFNRASVKLQAGDILYVAQLQGGRLPEGATTLPQGYSFRFLKVTVG